MENQNQQSSVPPSNLPSIPTSPPQIDKHTAVWLVILLFLVFPPAALFIIFKEKYYHGWLAILLWLYAIPLFLTYLVMRISVIPQLENLYKSLNVPNSIPVINSIIILFMVFLLAQIIFGIILFKKNRLIGYLSKNLLIIALLFFIMDLFVSPGFIIVGIVKPIYNLTSSIGEPTTPKTTQFSPTLIIDETANWKTYTDIKNEFSIQYPNNWYISAWPDTRAPHPEFDTVNFGRYKLPSTFQGNEELKKLGYIIEILIKKEDKTLEEIAKSNDETLKNRKGYKRENIIFQGLPALKIYNTGFDFPADTVILIKDKKLYSIGVKYLSDDKEAKEMYRKILSTFKFTDQNQTIDTSNWKTTQKTLSDGTKINFKHPSNWSDDLSYCPTPSEIQGGLTNCVDSAFFDSSAKSLVSEYSSGQSITVDGKKAIRQIDKTSKGVKAYKVLVFDSKDSPIFALEVYFQVDNPNISASIEKHIKTLDQIFSTLKITTSPTGIVTMPGLNWQTYINSGFGFSIQYPPDWNLNINGNPNTSLSNNDSVFILPKTPPTGFTPGGTGYLIAINIILNNSLNAYDYAKKEAYNPQGVSYATINGIQVVKSGGIQTAHNGGPIIYVQKNSSIIKISSEAVDDNTFNTILSTFKFTD